jgi:2-methylaconitate cis-trans-isomerase PrpF
LPKVLLLAPPRRGGTIASRYFAPSTCHATHALTGAVGLLAACNVPDSVAAQIGNPRARDLERIDVEHPGGHLQAFGRLEGRDHRSLPVFSSAGAVTTARPLFTGTVFVRSPAAGADEHRDPTPDRTAGGIGP